MRPREMIGTAIVGLLFGYGLSRIGFSSWAEVHAMFAFHSLRLTLTFGLAVVILAGAWWIIAARTGATWTPRRMHRGIVPGGLLFGAGWALAGACPAIALVQIGEGNLGGIATLVGIIAGNTLYPIVNRRWLSLNTASCRDD